MVVFVRPASCSSYLLSKIPFCKKKTIKLSTGRKFFIVFPFKYHVITSFIDFSKHLLTVFALGNIIYIGLEIAFLFSPDVPSYCHSAVYDWTFILQLLFVVLQTYFLFKNPQV